jgi:hypothetical protein
MTVSQTSFARKKPDQLVYLELGSGNGGMLLSISEDGFRFRAVTPLRPHGLMPFAFSFDGNRRLQGIGEVEWLEDDGKSGGMRFAEVSSEFRDALNQWLALDSRHAGPNREVTPAAATPLDTMEKIREDLRRGYSGSPAPKPERRDTTAEPPAVIPPKREAPPQKHEPELWPEHSTAAAGSSERAEPPVRGSSVADRKQGTKDFRNACSAPIDSEQPTTEQTPSQSQSERPAEEHAQPRFRPPFVHSAESAPPAPVEPASSAFPMKAPPAQPIASTPPTRIETPSVPAAPTTPETPHPAAYSHISTEALRRPFRAETRSGNPERPHIPPVDESFEAAWQHARLTAPPEAPHLSRAAAGSIIGIALAVILGALAFNFRQDIGELFIDLGQKISGENHATAPDAVPASRGETQSAVGPNASEPSPAQNKPETTAGAQVTPTQTTGNVNGSVDPHGANSGTPHEALSSAAHDAVSPATHGTTASTPASGAANPASNRVTGSTAAQIPAGNVVNSGESGSGQDEFNAARELLRGDHRQRDLSRAVDLLWAGVRKGYVPAEVTLADLYRRGDGVEKNCDQAQVLLVAASKKGSLEARHMLEQMAEAGCSE